MRDRYAVRVHDPKEPGKWRVWLRYESIVDAILSGRERAQDRRIVVDVYDTQKRATVKNFPRAQE